MKTITISTYEEYSVRKNYTWTDKQYNEFKEYISLRARTAQNDYQVAYYTVLKELLEQTTWEQVCDLMNEGDYRSIQKTYTYTSQNGKEFTEHLYLYDAIQEAMREDTYDLDGEDEYIDGSYEESFDINEFDE